MSSIVDRVNEQLRSLSLDCPVHEHPEVLTVEAWRPYVESGPVAGARLTKCLFLKDKKSRNYLVFALAETECDMKHLTKEVKNLFPEYAGIQTLRFGDEETLMETLAAAKGAVSPLNLVHDNGSEKKVNLIVDSRIDQLKDDNSVRLCCHPGSNGLTVYMTVNELWRYIESCGHNVHLQQLSA